MIFLKQYNNLVIQDISPIFLKTNIDFYDHITTLGMELDLSRKDQQKIYLHYFIIYLCNHLKAHNSKIVFFCNTFQLCDIHHKIIKKIKQIFGIRIWESPYDIHRFVQKLNDRDIDVIDEFEIWLNSEIKPKTFKHIKKFLDKEGFTALSDSYFQDIANKMTILC